jgi:alkylation response protein AidB-like acyl-CoA dehydrogenase
MFTAEQEQLREMVRAVLTKHAGPVERTVGTFDRTLWTQLADLGLTGLAAGEHGAGLVEVAVAVEEAGRALVAVPYLATMAASAVLSTSIPEPTTVAALGLAESGGVAQVLDADVAEVILVATDTALLAVEGPGPGASTVDHSRPVARLELDHLNAVRVGGAEEAAYARGVLHTLLAVEAVGVASASLEMTVAQLKHRVQFGVPLATFQALRHRVADLWVALEAATSVAWSAVRAPRAGLPVAGAVAKLVAADAAYRITAESIQLHGGIGFTWEHPAHRYFKRATVTRFADSDPPALRRLLTSTVAALSP